MKFFDVETVEFKNAIAYISNYVGNGEYFIPLGTDLTTASTTHVEEGQYDPSSMRIYQRQNDAVALKNNKALFGGEVLEVADLNKINLDEINGAIDKIGALMGGASAIIEIFKEIKGTHVWIPLSCGTPNTAIRMNIMNKVFIIIT